MTVSMSTVWDRTSEFLNSRLSAIAGIVAVAFFVPNLIMDILEPVGAAGSADLRIVLGLFSLVLTAVTVWGQLAVTAIAIDPQMRTATASGLATRRLGPMILVMLAFLVIGILVILPALAILSFSGVDLTRIDAPNAQPAAIAAVGGTLAIYLLALVPFALWLIARIAALCAAVVVWEELALGALGRAFRLTRGLTWKIIAVILLFAIVFLIAHMAAVSVFGAFFYFFAGSEGAFNTASVLTALVSALVKTIFSVAAVVFAAKLYCAVRDREQGAAA